MFELVDTSTALRLMKAAPEEDEASDSDVGSSSDGSQARVAAMLVHSLQLPCSPQFHPK